ncbi:epsilon DNA polymerase [Fomitiporia mediterranea MF3/22]|uniref:epsilon DNA polymerase n=1 Tax=Fomitiporia mediterranea (strain MF3/22) TaxID=694068 RepID=UPI00044081A7|nr:epsilon DNA polymerase [Fomitiporia mediterranea MF3/22]EJD01129.1 epsilon DNA polymerase [Fomitiporia mediterranea MF3/22]
MASSLQSTIIKGFRKYSHALGPEALQFVEDICIDAGLEDDLDEVEVTVERMAKEYNQQDDAVMKVSLPILQRVFAHLQDKEEKKMNGVEELLDPEEHLYFIDAYEMPLWHWSQTRATFEKAPHSPTISGTADSRITAIRDRHDIIKQTILRNDHFSPSTLPGKDRDRLLNLRSTKQLLGRAGERFLLFGLLGYSKEGKLCLEDTEGKVELDFSQLDIPSEGFFTEGCFALVEGDYTEEETLTVIAIGHPPCERREVSRSIFGHVDFLGKGSSTPLEDMEIEQRVSREFENLMFHCLSDVWLDHPETFVGLASIFDRCIEAEAIPLVFILCGNFTSRGIAQGNGREIQSYQENFDRLADLIASYPIIARNTHFVFVPGPLDITANSVLPRRPLLSSFVGKLNSKLAKAHFLSNPCRIKCFGQEIVVYREDMMARMLRNLVGVKPDVQNDDMKRFLVQSIIDQAHLSPFTKNVQPILSEYDHTLRLYPMPSAVILADKYEGYELTYEGCHVFNPGSFIGNSFGFYTYFPSKHRSESS